MFLNMVLKRSFNIWDMDLDLGSNPSSKNWVSAEEEYTYFSSKHNGTQKYFALIRAIQLVLYNPSAIKNRLFKQITESLLTRKK